MHVAYALDLPEDIVVIVIYRIEAERFFLRIDVTMISKRFVKLGILVCYSRKYKAKMTL